MIGIVTFAVLMGVSMSPSNAAIDAQLVSVQERCGLSPYFLRIDGEKRVTIHVPPEVRARLLTFEQMECARAELAKRGLQLADPSPVPTPATAADLQSHLDRIHYFCELGPYELKAKSATRAAITIPPTIRARPLTRRQLRCVKQSIEPIRGVTLEQGVVPTVD